MKKLLAALLACAMCFSMMGCSTGLIDTLEGINSFLDEFNSSLDALIESAGYNTSADNDTGTDSAPAKPYKIPIILLHGRASNTEVFFGVRTAIDTNTNSYYGTDFEEMYANPDSHEILSIEEGRLGEYLTEQLGYEPNKNLFAFNYPNVDMVEMNAKRLAQYINNLVEAGAKGESGTENFVDPDCLFASDEARADKQVKFILIGHSMGGLVSRYYIENLGTEHVEKLITICTPHYGSGLGLASDLINLPFKPCDLDLRPDSQLFGGEKLSDYDIICISGSLPQGIDESFYAEVIRLCKEEGKKVIADASEKVLGKIIDEKPFMIKPNRYELSVLMGKEISSRDDIKEALLFMKNKGIELPLITLGKDGAMAYIGERFYKFNSPCVEVKNAVGSGDSSVAGIAVGLSRGMNALDAIRLGMASGTANTQFEETGFVSCELVEKYYKEITVETIV